MSHDATMRRMYDLISAGDIDGLIDLLADDFVDHEQMPPGIAKDKSGVVPSSRGNSRRCPTCGWTCRT